MTDARTSYPPATHEHATLRFRTSAEAADALAKNEPTCRTREDVERLVLSVLDKTMGPALATASEADKMAVYSAGRALFREFVEWYDLASSEAQ